MTAVPSQQRPVRMQRLRLVEIAAWTAGLTLLITYGAIRAWSANASLEGIAVLQWARAERIATHASWQDVSTFDLPLPDTTNWSQARLAAYREGIRRKEVPKAVLRIPALKLTVPIYDGTSELNLNRGAGRIEGTARVDEDGNVGIAGHRDGFFRVLKDVRVGEPLYLDTPDNTLSYRIVSTNIVDPKDVEVLSSTVTPTITLVTCYPFYFVGSAPKRFIVRAQRVASPLTQANLDHFPRVDQSEIELR